MGTFKLEILLGTRAMKDRRDVTDALGKVRTRLAHGDTEGLIRDRDNHVVGNWELQDGAQLSFDDHPLVARVTDPNPSHLVNEKIAAREGSTGTFTPGTQKHLILLAYARAGTPLTDTQAWKAAGLGPRSGAWHRCSDMKDAGVIRQVDEIADPETGNQVRRCEIVEYGHWVLSELQADRRVKPPEEAA